MQILCQPDDVVIEHKLLHPKVGISVDVQTILQDTEIKIAFTLKSTVPSLHANEATYVIRVQYSISL